MRIEMFAFMSLLHVKVAWKCWCCISLVVEKPDITSKISHELNPLDPFRDPENCDIMLILLSTFFTNPHNYGDNCKYCIFILVYLLRDTILCEWYTYIVNTHFGTILIKILRCSVKFDICRLSKFPIGATESMEDHVTINSSISKVEVTR